MDATLKDNKTVKFLLEECGFTEEYIEKSINAGDIKIEKSAAEGDHESETKQEKKIDKLENEAVDAEKKVKKDEKDTAEDKDAEGKKVEKSESEKEDMMKAMGEVFMKSLGTTFAPLLEGMSNKLEALADKVDKIGEQQPSFRSGDLNNMSAIQKSLSFEKDEAGKHEVNIITQRPAASKIIEKALDGAPDLIAKSLQDDALAYLTNPDATEIGESLARYCYEKGVKFVK